MPIWSAEIKELEKLHESFKDQLSELDKELGKLIKADDENMILLYSRRCLEVIISDLCECELRRDRGSEPLKGIIDKLNKEKKIPAHIASSMYGLNELSTYGTHPKDFDPEQIKPVLVNLDIIIKWYLKYKDFIIVGKQKPEVERIKPDKSEVNESVKSIAVLPFVDMSPERDQGYFCEGMAEEIINTLAHIEDFKVIARTSAFAFKDKQTDIREIGRILNVETLLEGSIRKAGNRLRITAQLIKVADGTHIWSERYDRELKDVFDIQDEISLAIADNLKIKLIGEKKAMISKKHSNDLEAYNLYLKGTYWWQMVTLEGFNKASGYYEQALKKDSGYALAYCGLAAANIMSTTFGDVSPDEAYPKAIEYADKALKLDNMSAEAYWILGSVNTFYYWNWKKAELNLNKAVQINPNSSLIHIFYSFLLTYTGRNEEAIAEAKRAQELDPLSGFINTYTGLIYQWAGKIEKAIEEHQMTITLYPNYFLAHFHLGIAYRMKAMYMEAASEYKKSADLSNGSPFAIACLIINYFRCSEIDQAEKLLNSLKIRSVTEYVPASSFYLIYATIGKEELAMEWLKRACKEHDTMLPWIRTNPQFMPEGSKYMALVKEMGLDY